MIVRLLLLFLLVPLSELALLVWLGRDFGLVPTVVLMVVSGVLGAFLARRQGAATWLRFRKALGSGKLPAEELVDGVLVLVSAAVLLAPGILTDLAGLALMVPAFRRPVGRWINRYLQRRLAEGLKSRLGDVPPRMDPDTMEAEYRVVVDDDAVDVETADEDGPRREIPEGRGR